VGAEQVIFTQKMQRRSHADNNYRNAREKKERLFSDFKPDGVQIK